MAQPINIKDQVFSRLTVIKKSQKRTIGGDIVWECLCACGNTVFVGSSSIRSGHTKSCGCLHVGPTATRYKHGGYSLNGHPLYATWRAMLSRCNNKNDEAFKYYGKRGIKVCQRWMVFEVFLADMGERPNGLSIERRDNDKGYNKSNCYWGTREIQARNRSNVKLTLEKAIQIVKCRKHGMTYREIGEKFGIKLANAYCIASGKSWKEAQAMANEK